MAYCSASQAATNYDKSQSDRDDYGEAILTDAQRDLYPNKTLFNMALQKELSQRLTMTHIQEHIVDAMNDPCGNFFRIRLEQLPEAILDDDELLSAILMRSVWQAIKKPLINEIKNEFEDNPWKIEEVLNAN